MPPHKRKKDLERSKIKVKDAKVVKMPK